MNDPQTDRKVQEFIYAHLLEHVGHHIECVHYGAFDETDRPSNVSVECVDCRVVLIDMNRDFEEDIKDEGKGSEESA